MTTPVRLLSFAAGAAALVLVAGCGQGKTDAAVKTDPAAQAAADAAASASAVPVTAEPVVAAPLPDGARRVAFEAGATSVSLSGSVNGDDTPVYVVSARRGQTMTVTVSGSPNVSFNIYAPGDKPGESEAMFIGATGGNSFTGPLAESGDYLIQLGQPRAQARRNEASDYSLAVVVTGG